MASRTASSASATRMIGSVGPKVSSVMHFIEWSTSTSTVGSKKRPAPCTAWPPASMRAPFSHSVGDVSLDRVELRREGDRADLDRAGSLRLADAAAHALSRTLARRTPRRPAPRHRPARSRCTSARRSASRSRRRRSRPARDRHRRGRSSDPCRRARARRGSAAAPPPRRPCARSCVEPVNMTMSTSSIKRRPGLPAAGGDLQDVLRQATLAQAFGHQQRRQRASPPTA